MPSSSNIDERVVRMRMDNEQFEKGAQKTINTLEKLEKSMDFKESKGGIDLSPIEKSLDAIQNKFSALQIVGKRALENITDSAINLAKQAITGVDQIRPGYGAYEQQVSSIQKLMIATGESMETVQSMSDKILTFTNETSYDYKSMLDTIASFTSSGRGLKESEEAVIGMAVAAAQSGTSAQDATHAFTGFQRAIAQGYMSSANWQWIKTAGMNSALLKETLIDAAIATGDLHKEADGITYAYEETAKGVKKTAVTIENFDTSFSEQWLGREAILKGLNDYSVAFNQMYDIAQETGKPIWKIMEEMGDQFDEFSYKAFEAGQVTKTYSDALNAIKATVQSGWMKSFELIIGNFEQAKGFWSDLINPLWDIFVKPGDKRNEFFQAAFGGGQVQEQKQTIVNWDKLSTKITEVGKETKDLEDAFKKVSGSSQDEKIKSLASEFDSLEEAIKAGAVEGDFLKQILEEIGIVSKASTDEAVEGANEATKAFQEYREVAMGVLRGDFGNGQERRDALAELGYDYDTIQWLAGNLHWLHENGWAYEGISDEYLLSLPKFENVQQVLDSLGTSLESTTGSYIDLNEVMDETDMLLEEAAKKSGRELWQESVLNVVHLLADAFTKLGEAFDEVFGDAKSRGEGFRGWLVRIWELTQGLENSETVLESVKSTGVKVFSFLKRNLKNLGNSFRIIRKAIKLILGVFSDIFSGISNLFKGKINLPEKLQNTETFLGRIFSFLSNIFDRIREFFNGKTVFTILEDVIDKIEEVRQHFKNGGTISELFKGLFGKGDGEETTGFLSSFLSFFNVFKEDSEAVADSVSRMGQSVGEFSTAIGKVSEVGGLFYEGIFGDPTTFKEKMSGFWTTIKNLFVTEYNKINWASLLSVGELGLVGFMIFKMNETFKSLKSLLNGPTGILQIINKFQSNLTSPLTALSSAIKNNEKSNRYLKIAAAISVLATSLYLLAQVPEDKLYNVAVTMGFLMLIMSRMAKSMEGFQLFSNNNKTISKNNPINQTTNLLQGLQKAFTIDLTGATANISLLPKTMGILLGIAAVLTSVVYAIVKLKDIAKPGELEQLIPTFIIIGSVIAAMIATVGILGALTKNSKYIGKVGGTMLAMAASILLIVNAITKIGKLDRTQLDWTAMLVMFGMMIALFAAIGFVLKAASGLTTQGNSAFTSGSAVWGVAATMLALAFTMRSLVKTMAKASEIQDLTKGLVLIAALFLSLVVVLTIMDAITNGNGTGPDGMLKIAGAMAILAVSIGLLVPAIMLMAALPAAGIMAAAAAISLLLVAMAGSVWIMSQIDTKKMLIAASAFAILSIGMAALIGVIGALTIVMIALSVGIPWETLSDRTDAFAEALTKIAKPMLKLSAAALLLGVGLLFAAVGIGIAGVSFVLLSAGLLLGALALEHFGNALTSIGEGLPNFISGLSEAFEFLGKDWNWLKVIGMLGLLALAFIAVKKAVSKFDLSSIEEKTKDLGPKLIAGIQNIIKALQLASPQLIKAFLSLGALAITAIALLVPFAVAKLVTIIVNVIHSLASALYANSGALIAAFEELVGTIFAIFIKALVSLSGDILGFLGDFIAELIRVFAPGALGNKVADFIERTFGSEMMEPAIDKLGEATDRALEKSFLNKNHQLKAEATVEPTLDLNDPDLDAALTEYQQNMIPAGEAAGETLGETTGEAAGTAVSTSLIGLGGENGIVSSAIGQAFGNAGDMIDTEAMFGSVSGTLTETLGGEGMTSVLDGIGATDGSALIGGLTSSLTGSDASSGLQGAASSVFSSFSNTFDTESASGTSILGNNTIVGLFNSLTSKADELLPGAGAHAFGKYSEGYNSAADQHSPSREMMKYGRFTIMGLAQGLINNANLANDAGVAVGNGLMSEFQRIMQQVAMIADEDFTITPTITPVVDMTNIDSAAGTMNGAFGQNYRLSAQVTGNVARRMNDVERVASGMEAMNQTINNGDTFTVNVYASEGMDENALADAVMARLQSRLVRRGAAFG